MNKPEDLKYKMVTIVDNTALQGRDKIITTPTSFFSTFWYPIKTYNWPSSSVRQSYPEGSWKYRFEA